MFLLYTLKLVRKLRGERNHLRQYTIAMLLCSVDFGKYFTLIECMASQA